MGQKLGQSLERYHQRCLRRIFYIKWKNRRTNGSVLEEANVISIESYIIMNWPPCPYAFVQTPKDDPVW